MGEEERTDRWEGDESGRVDSDADGSDEVISNQGNLSLPHSTLNPPAWHITRKQSVLQGQQVLDNLKRHQRNDSERRQQQHGLSTKQLSDLAASQSSAASSAAQRVIDQLLVGSSMNESDGSDES